MNEEVFRQKQMKNGFEMFLDAAIAGDGVSSSDISSKNIVN